ncbi:MAG TPA: hypothetical protein VFQ53_04510 [Kofleriaceae bacterium]|nr:hypothetical protein [Kofleriaceae bacterium]
MSAYVIGVVRSAMRLDTLTYEAREPTDREVPWRVEQACTLRPLAHGSHPELWTAWHALAAVDRWDAATRDHVLAVLRATVPSVDAPGDLPAIVHEMPAPPRATAAHPRAFRGTKHRPPRPRQPDAVDVRPYLLARRHIDHVLALVGERRGSDPYVAWRHGVDATAGFEPSFVMYLLPLLTACRWSEVGAFAALARGVDPELRAALVGVYLEAGEPARALGWWHHVLAHPAEQRVEAAQLVGRSGVAKLAPVEPAVAAVVASLPAQQQWWFYRGLVVGATPVYLEAGLALGALSCEPPPGTLDVAAVIEATVERLADAMDEDSGAAFWRTHLWTMCGHQPELAAVLASPAFESLHPAAAFWLIRIADSPRWSPETAVAEWRALAPVLPRLVDGAVEVAPAYQRKLVEDLGDVYYWAVANEHDILDALAHCLELALRVAKPPFGTTSVLGDVLAHIAVNLETWEERRLVEHAPDASFVVLEDACKRANQARLVGRGLNRLSQFAPALLVSSFARAPGALVQTADLLAAISFESAEALLVAYGRSPLADPALADASIERLCEMIAPIAQAGGPNPVRRALRQHLSGERTLSDAQVRGHRERIVAELDVIRLAAIRQAVERMLAARVGIERIAGPTVRHAVAMLDGVDVHRRQLRRMLTATLAGDAQWRLRHPRTQAWLARHPKLDREVWLRGIETTGRIDGIGEVTLAIESDPLEALKLGTYVGSCLGRGGHFAFSAAAVVLDINKHVVYARDARGAVIGRQLVAVSEADELVCFSVYGTASLERLEPLFRAFDQAFAAQLGLPLYGSDDEYVIATILSLDWFDDTAWREVAAT